MIPAPKYVGQSGTCDSEMLRLRLFTMSSVHKSARLRERPFDFQGGGGGGFEKNILALIFVKKNILASTQTKKNSLTLGM